MKKASSATAAGKKTNANSSSTTMTTKRKEIDSEAMDNANDSQPVPSLLPKKGRYKDDTATETENKNISNPNLDGKVSHATNSSNGAIYGIQALPQNQAQFTFGALPDITDAPFKATIIICKRSTLQQILNEGYQLLNAMLGLNLSTNILQSMFTDCGGSSSKGVSVASTYVDNESNNITHHKLYFMTVPDTVSRCNHSWSVHSISDAIKIAVGGNNTSTCCRIVFCGTGVASQMGSLTASIARAFSVYTRKTKKVTLSDDTSVLPSPPTLPRIHVSFMDVSDSGIQESIPTNNGDHLLYVCESIQLTARLADMVRCCFYVIFFWNFAYYLVHKLIHIAFNNSKFVVVTLAPRRTNDNGLRRGMSPYNCLTAKCNVQRNCWR